MRKFSLCLISLSIIFFFIGCASSTTKKDQAFFEETSLANYTEVIKSEIPDADLYASVRQYFATEIRGGSFNVKDVINQDKRTANMLRVPFESEEFRFPTNAGGMNVDAVCYLKFTIVVEFREGRMKLTLTDTKIDIYAAYDSYVPVTDENIPEYQQGVGNQFYYYLYVTGREKGAALYKKWQNEISTKFNEFAQGINKDYDW